MQSPPKENKDKSNDTESHEKTKSPQATIEEKETKSPPATIVEKETKSPQATIEATNNLDKSVVTIDSSDQEMENQSMNDSQITEKDDSILIDCNVTPKRNIKDLKVEKGSSKKKNNSLSKEERERKKQEERDEREKQKREKQEQKIKERQEKEEQKRKEREEKEEQKRKEREEKEEQKRKEKEEKEELKRKEKEEKEAQKIKEREEKEEQKKKQKEEKETQKQQELQKEKKKIQKESAAFLNFFVPRKSTGGTEPKPKHEEVVSNFMPFQIKADMRLAPLIRRNLSEEQKEDLLNKISEQEETNENLYLTEIKNRTLGKSTKTWPVEEDEVQILDDTGIGECVEEQKVEKQKMRAKYLLFHENRRPAYHGTWRKKSKNIRPRNPLGEDKEIFDYEVDSDDDWEEEEPGESLHGSDDEEKENDSDEYEVDNDFFVPHGYLSDEEIENEQEGDVQLTPETQKEKLKHLQLEFEEEMKSKTERIKPRLIGCIWESKLKPKIQDAISSFLEDRMMIIPAPILIKKREFNKENVNSTNKTSTPSRKQLSKELIPEFLKMIHGNTNNKIYLVNEFLNYLSANHKDVIVSKAGLTAQMKELAAWKKCPDEGAMFNKNCWYVEADVRKQFNLNISLPNKNVNNSEENPNAKKKLSL